MLDGVKLRKEMRMVSRKIPSWQVDSMFYMLLMPEMASGGETKKQMIRSFMRVSWTLTIS
jgi:hypothetical protein